MKVLALLFVLFVSAAFGNIYFPVFFGNFQNILPYVFLLVLPIYYGSDRRAIILGTVSALLFETVLGMRIGQLSVPFLAVMTGYSILGRFIQLVPAHRNQNIKLTGYLFIALVTGLFYCIFWVVSWIIIRLIYDVDAMIIEHAVREAVYSAIYISASVPVIVWLADYIKKEA